MANITKIGDLILSEKAQPLESGSELQKKLSNLFGDIQWSTYDGNIFGQVHRSDISAEFTIPLGKDNIIDGIVFSGPKDWVSSICKNMRLFCYDPQIAELWTPEGECISLQR